MVRTSAILVVDDDPATVRMLERMLERAGYLHVVGTTDSYAAVELYRAVEPDLVLLDLHMPDMDGWELMEALREDHPPRSFMPIVAITADTSPEVRFRALLLGVQDFLTKPLDFLDTVLRIQNLLEVRYLVRELQRENQRIRTGEMHGSARDHRCDAPACPFAPAEGGFHIAPGAPSTPLRRTPEESCEPAA